MWETQKRVDYLLDKLDKLTHGDKAASDQIVAECFPKAWDIFTESQQPTESDPEGGEIIPDDREEDAAAFKARKDNQR